MSLHEFPRERQPEPTTAELVEQVRARQAAREQIAARVREQFTPDRHGRDTLAYKCGTFAMQLVQLVDAFDRYATHKDYCSAATCRCGLDETRAEAKRQQVIAAAEVGLSKVYPADRRTP